MGRRSNLKFLTLLLPSALSGQVLQAVTGGAYANEVRRTRARLSLPRNAEILMQEPPRPRITFASDISAFGPLKESNFNPDEYLVAANTKAQLLKAKPATTVKVFIYFCHQMPQNGSHPSRAGFSGYVAKTVPIMIPDDPTNPTRGMALIWNTAYLPQLVNDQEFFRQTVLHEKSHIDNAWRLHDLLEPVKQHILENVGPIHGPAANLLDRYIQEGLDAWGEVRAIETNPNWARDESELSYHSSQLLRFDLAIKGIVDWLVAQNAIPKAETRKTKNRLSDLFRDAVSGKKTFAPSTPAAAGSIVGLRYRPLDQSEDSHRRPHRQTAVSA